MIQFSDVFMSYPGGHEALHNVNLFVEQGAMAFIAGRSGAGKSTLLRLIGLIDRSSHGQIIVNGQNLDKIRGSNIALFRRNIGYTFQDHRLLNDRTVFDNVSLPLIVSGFSHLEIRKRVQAALDKVGLLNKQRSLPITLSSGEQQRVGIARAVVHRPTILLADEPTGNLDPGLSLEIMKLFEQFNQVGVTVLVASHDMDMLRKMNKHIVILRDGRILPGHATEEYADV